MRPKYRAELLRHKKKPWGVAFQRTSNWEASTTQSAYTGPSHPAIIDSLRGRNQANERGLAKWGLEGHQNSPMGPRHIKLNSLSRALTWAMQLRRQNSGIKKKMPLHHPIWKKEYRGPRIFAKSYKAWSLPLGFLRRVMRPHSMPRLPQKALLRNLMMAPISGAKSSGFRGAPVPHHKKYRYSPFK